MLRPRSLLGLVALAGMSFGMIETEGERHYQHHSEESFMPDYVASTNGNLTDGPVSVFFPRAPLLGNGDLGIVVSTIAPEHPWPEERKNGTNLFTFHLSANHFWAMDADIRFDPTKNMSWLYIPAYVTIGGITFFFEEDFSSSHIEQQIRNGTIATRHTNSKTGEYVESKTILDPEVNTIVTSITFVSTNPSAETHFVHDHWTTKPDIIGGGKNGTKAGCFNEDFSEESGCREGPSAYFTRKTIGDDAGGYPTSRYQLNMAVASRVFGDTKHSHLMKHGDLSVIKRWTLKPNSTVVVVTRALSTFENGGGNVIEGVRKYLGNLTTSKSSAIVPESVTSVMERNCDWWTHFWSESSVSLPDHPDLQQYYYFAQYIMGCASREGKTAPGLWGPWVTTDNPVCRGDYTLDYNFEAGMFGVYSSNHVKQVESYFKIVEDSIPLGHLNARLLAERFNKTCDPGAIHFASHLAPYGMSANIGLSPKGDLNLRWNGMFAATAFMNNYEYTGNVEFMRETTYPLLTGLALFWECWMEQVVPEGSSPNEYVLMDYFDCASETQEGEKCNGNDFVHNGTNPMQAVAFVRRALEFLVDNAAEANQTDASFRWQKMLDHFPPYPEYKELIDGVNVTRWAQSASLQAGGLFTTYPVFPSDLVSLASPPDLVKMAKTTVGIETELGDVGYPYISMVAMVRFGFPNVTYLDNAGSSSVLSTVEALERYIRANLIPESGFLHSVFGGLEMYGLTNVVNELLLMAPGGEYLTFFHTWRLLPRRTSVSFKNLRQKGAFVASAAYNNTTDYVSGVVVTSEAGNICKIDTPWRAGQPVYVTDVTTNSNVSIPVHLNGTFFTFATSPHHTYTISDKA